VAIDQTRIPSLDGLRAISIGLVVLAHARDTPGFPNVELPTDAIGMFGVRVFFVISGFLITKLLLKEADQTGRIKLGSFYFRRALRIFPAFYVYLAVLCLLTVLHVVQVTRVDILQAATYTVNYFPWDSQSNLVRHIWSLSNEEQFYLLWPFCVAFFLRSTAMYIAASALLLTPMIRFIVMSLGPPMVLTIDRRFDCIADVLATGCLLAGLSGRLGESEHYLSFLRSRWFYVVPAVTGVFAMSMAHPHIYFLVGQSIVNIGIALCIDRVVRYPEMFAGRILNLAPLRFVGVLSYSLYLWQQLFLGAGTSAWWGLFPLNVVLAFVAAVGSYYLVEKPFLGLRRYSPYFSKKWAMVMMPLK
jgi:peptidoglycan/LPS O-acetylase OafA/YrhL